MINVAARKRFSVEQPEYFNQFERQRLLIDQSRTLLNMVPYDFELNCIRRLSSQMLKDAFLTPLEMLFGMSYSFLYLKRPKKVVEFLDHINNLTDRSAVTQTLIERVIDNDPLRKKQLSSGDLYFDVQTLTEDFNFKTPLDRAMKLNLIKTAELFMETLQDSKNNVNVSRRNQIMAMGSLERILQQENIPESFI